MSKHIYFECGSGISGDMTVASLLDLGADEQVLRKALASLPMSDEFEIKISRVNKSGLDACDFDVILKEHQNHDHDMEYLHGSQHHEAQPHIHEKHQQGRTYADIVAIISDADLTDMATTIALKVFDILAEAEAKAHNVPKDKVHFHEVGAVDSIVDVVAFAVCMDNLGIDEVCVPSISEGQGTVRCQHGVIPVPVPAVVNIVAANHLVLQSIGLEGEFVTPTGAAMIAAVITSRTLPSQYTIEKTGMGAGKREYERPSILRVFIIDSIEDDNLKKDAEEIEVLNWSKSQKNESRKKDTIFKLEANIDDCTGEILGYVMGELLEAGARDVHYTPVFMKKNRPAYQLNVICKKADISAMEKIIFRETTTIGIRRVEMERSVLERENLLVPTIVGNIDVKVCWNDDVIHCYPEYNSIVKILEDNKDLTPRYSFREIYSWAEYEASEIIKKRSTEGE